MSGQDVQLFTSASLEHGVDTGKHLEDAGHSQRVKHLSAAFLVGNHPSLLQNREMSRNSGEVNPYHFRKVVDAPLLVRQLFNDEEPGGVSHRFNDRRPRFQFRLCSFVHHLASCHSSQMTKLLSSTCPFMAFFLKR
jgi:hypothetical protein